MHWSPFVDFCCLMMWNAWIGCIDVPAIWRWNEISVDLYIFVLLEQDFTIKSLRYIEIEEETDRQMTENTCTLTWYVSMAPWMLGSGRRACSEYFWCVLCWCRFQSYRQSPPCILPCRFVWCILVLWQPSSPKARWSLPNRLHKTKLKMQINWS